MVLLEKIMVNLSSKHHPNLLGHISIYELKNGNISYVYYIEEKFYASKEVCSRTSKLIKEEGSDHDYHYSVDIFFNDKKRYLGWSKGSKGVYFSD